MALSLYTAPTDEPLSLADAKTHLKVEDGTDDALIRELIRAACEHCETFTGRKCISQTFDLKLSGFPCGAIELPFPPVSSVTSVTYVDTNGDSQTWSSALYQTDLPAGPQATVARIQPAYQQVYPQTRDQWNAVTVRFVVGYGGPQDVPGSIQAAMKLLIGHWYANREAVAVSAGTVPSEIAIGVDRLLWPYVVG